MIEHIVPNIYKVAVPLPKNPLKAINSYVITGEKRNLIIDTGMNREECLSALRAGLAEIKVDLAKTDFIITHLHVDHSGLAATLVTPGGRVYASRQDASMINAFSGPDCDAHWSPMRGYALAQGFPAELLTMAITRHPGYLYRPEHQVDFTPLAEGDVISIAGYNFQCILTPGHTRGHICLYEPDQKILISGDHILGDITPNISQWIEEEDALATYFASLDKVNQLTISMVLPGHRNIFADCRGRINQLKEHHFRRLEEVWCILKDQGPLTAYEVATQMTWDMRGVWADFPIPQKWFAHGEAIAHIKYLQKKGRIVCLRDQDIVRFMVPENN